MNINSNAGLLAGVAVLFGEASEVVLKCIINIRGDDYG